ncbi:DASH complex subunit Duo1-domain-containing protein [Lasiosphaeria miniovina]|uniref:DASH complex subunit DUO1 n=1 Tax=Lasiosphaeria miniovina TaxID=1954250 RepID=A0AA40A5H4_9PEZI|nr:DASH complex subunit Duo1-domain-containing protein [Lasiosphaeria miniovina]KAK0709575.1 DASH complex subunit Duo1-domain-containing protein [Lasiosphaeria miniovina]
MADNFESSDHEDLFASPSAERQQPQPERAKTPANQNSRFDAEEARETALRRELEGVRNINEVIEGVIATLERAKGNMGTVSKTVDNASALLNTWTRILSQTEYNQRLILNPDWNGATQDLADIENEALQKQRDAERRAAEAERRREEARRKAEDEDRQRTAGTAPPRGAASRGHTRAGRDTSSGRGASGIGRGLGYTRGGRSTRGGVK